MAYTTVNKSSLYQNTKLYTGTGSSNAITGVGFQPDLTWIKDRDATNNHSLYDAVRGVTKVILSNANNAETTYAQGLTAFGADGFTVGTDSQNNTNTNDLVSWNWKAGTAVSGSTSGSGTAKTYTGSKNTIAGFSIIKYVGNGTAGHTIPHELGAVPDCVIVKNLDAGSTEWRNMYPNINTANYNLNWNATNTWNDGTEFNDTMPTTSVFTVSAQGDTNTNDVDYIAYCWKNITGYSKMGSYLGNASTNGTFVYTGFKPSFVIVKSTGSQNNWEQRDNKRPGYNLTSGTLYTNDSAVENTGEGIDMLSNGFKCRASGNGQNGSHTYVYMAFGQTLVGTNNVPATAR